MITLMTTITRRDLDDLAAQLLEHEPFDPLHEQCFVILYVPTTNRFLLRETPNRHEDPTEQYRMEADDVQVYCDAGMTVMGVVHTHMNREGNAEPSVGDFEKFPAGYIGGVYMIDHNEIFWFDQVDIIHISMITEESRA